MGPPQDPEGLAMSGNIHLLDGWMVACLVGVPGPGEGGRAASELARGACVLVCADIALLQVLQVNRGPLVALGLKTGTWSC